MSVENNQDIRKELLQEAEDLGIKIHPNAKDETIQEKINEKLAEIAEKQKAKKEAKKAVKDNKVKVIINPRDGDDKVQDQFFGLSAGGIKENILIKFDEEVEVSERMLAHIKSLGGNVHKFKMVNDEDGIPQKKWYTKWQSRFLVEKVD